MDPPSFKGDFIWGREEQEQQYFKWLEEQENLPADLKKYTEVEVAWNQFDHAGNGQNFKEAIEKAAIDFDQAHLFKEVTGTGLISEKQLKPTVYAKYLTSMKTLPADVGASIKIYAPLTTFLCTFTGIQKTSVTLEPLTLPLSL